MARFGRRAVNWRLSIADAFGWNQRWAPVKPVSEAVQDPLYLSTSVSRQGKQGPDRLANKFIRVSP